MIENLKRVWLICFFLCEPVLAHIPSNEEREEHTHHMQGVDYGWWIFGILVAIVLFYVVFKNLANYLASREKE